MFFMPYGLNMFSRGQTLFPQKSSSCGIITNIAFKNGSQSQTHSLQANDTFNKQQWLNCIRQAKQTVLCATGPAAVLDSEGPFLDPATGSREPRGETKLEQMDQSDSESDCSMDMSEVSLDCERMEQTDSSCGNSRHVESNV